MIATIFWGCDVLTLNRPFCGCNEILRRWSFDSKPTLLCLQRDFEAIGNVIHCLLLSKLKLGLELKRKNEILRRWSFDSKPTLSMFATRFWRNRKCYSLPSTFIAEARFRVKTKVPPEATISEQFLPHIADVKKYFLSRWWNSWVWCSSVVSVQGSCFSVTVEFVSLL